jgi:hypothetical protein
MNVACRPASLATRSSTSQEGENLKNPGLRWHRDAVSQRGPKGPNPPKPDGLGSTCTSFLCRFQGGARDQPVFISTTMFWNNLLSDLIFCFLLISTHWLCSMGRGLFPGAWWRGLQLIRWPLMVRFFGGSLLGPILPAVFFRFIWDLREAARGILKRLQGLVRRRQPM